MNRSEKTDIESHGPLEAKALAQMRQNVRSGFDPRYRFHYSYVMPSPGRYQWQWFWDSCFHAIALSRLDVEMAKRELQTLMVPQREDGFIGHLTYWGRRGAVLSAIFGQSRPGEWRRRNSGMIQPPVLAQALLSVWRASRDTDFLRSILPKVRGFYEWLARERDTRSDGLIGVVSPYECGLDNSPAYDAALGLKRPRRRSLLWKNWLLDMHNAYMGGGFDYHRLLKRNRMVMIDPFVNAVYADGWDAIATMHEELGELELANRAYEMRNKTIAGLERQCWDEKDGRWIFLSGSDRTPERALTVACIMPIIISGIDPGKVSRVVEGHLLNPDQFWTEHPVPSVAASEDTFDPEGESTIWRGPVCLNLNWLLARGLRRRGYDDVAEEIETKSKLMAAREFREFYSPLTGRGLRGENFGWATVAVDMPSIA